MASVCVYHYFSHMDSCVWKVESIIMHSIQNLAVLLVFLLCSLFLSPFLFVVYIDKQFSFSFVEDIELSHDDLTV